MTLFDNAILRGLDWSKAQCTYTPAISLAEPGDGYKVSLLLHIWSAFSLSSLKKPSSSLSLVEMCYKYH